MNGSKLAKFLRWGIYAVAFMPLIIFSQYLSPFHFGKIVVFRSWVEILSVFYVTLVLRDRSYLPSKNSILISVTFFTAIFGIATATSVDIYQSFWGTLERMGGWFSFFHFWLFFVIACGVMKQEEGWIRLIKLSVFASLLSTCYGFLQKTNWTWIIGSGGRERIFGTIGNPALFAGYEVLNVFLALWLTLTAKTRGQKLFFGLVFVLDMLAIFSTAVRGTLLAVVIALIVFAYLYFGVGGSKKLKRLLVWGIGAMIALEGFLILVHNSGFVKNSSYLSRLSDVSLKTRTVNTRFWAWQAGIDGWNDSARTVIIGWGPENFNLPFSKHFNPKFYVGPGSETMFDRGHNMFVEVLVTMGLLGLLSYLAVFWFLFKTLRWVLRVSQSKDEKLLAVTLISTFIAYIIHNFFIFDTSANLMAFFFLLGFSYFLKENAKTKSSSARAELSAGEAGKSAPVFGVVLATVVLLVLALFSIYKTNIKPVLANYAATRGIVASWDGDHQKAVDKFTQALSYKTFGEYEIRHRYGQYVMENLSKFQNRDDQNHLLLSVIENVKKNIRPADQDYLPHLYISRAYILLGRSDPNSKYNDLALEHSLRAVEISPTFIRGLYEVAQGYLNKKDNKKAAEYFQKAAEANPDVGDSWWYWAITETDAGNINKGLELIKKAVSSGYKLSDQDYGRLLNAYIKANSLPQIVQVYLELIKIQPDNPQFHASLAATYKKLGNIDGAEREARKAAELDPTFLLEAKQFIENLGRRY